MGSPPIHGAQLQALLQWEVQADVIYPGDRKPVLIWDAPSVRMLSAENICATGHGLSWVGAMPKVKGTGR